MCLVSSVWPPTPRVNEIRREADPERGSWILNYSWLCSGSLKDKFPLGEYDKYFRSYVSTRSSRLNESFGFPRWSSRAVDASISGKQAHAEFRHFFKYIFLTENHCKLAEAAKGKEPHPFLMTGHSGLRASCRSFILPKPDLCCWRPVGQTRPFNNPILVIWSFVRKLMSPFIIYLCC